MGAYPSSDTAETEAACKMRAVIQFAKMRGEVWSERERYAAALGLRGFGRSGLGESGQFASSAGGERRPTGVNLSFRYMQRLTAEVTGQPLHVKMSRDAGAGQSQAGDPEQGAIGDESIAEWVEIGVSRVMYEAGTQRETDASVVDLCAYGVTGSWIGYHADVVGLEEAREAAKDVSGDPVEDPSQQQVDPADSNIVAETVAGDVQAKPGQDHRAIAATLRDAAAVIPAGTDPNAMAALLARAQSHDAMGATEAKAKTGEARVIQRKIWEKRGIVGFDTFWHPSVYEFEDSPWVCRRVLPPLEMFKRWGEIKAKYRTQAKGVADRYRPTVESPGKTSPSPEATKGDPSEKYVECYVFWIREPWRPDGGRRKIACPEFPGEWIEADEGNPYVDDEGRQLIEGFFPFFYCAPLLPPLEDPKRTLGTALIEPGARTEERINEFLSTILAHYKRHGFRVYALHPLLKGKTKIKEALRQGIDGFTFDAPSGMKDAKEMQGLIVPIQFSGQAEQMERMLAKLIEFWRIEQGFPAASLLGTAQSETATQEQIGVEAGNNELGVIAGRIEEWVAAKARGILGLMRGFYLTEKMRELLGAEGSAAWDAYRETSTSGDRLTVKLGARAARSEAVSIEQLMKAIEVDRTTLDPVLGVRTLDEMPLIEELHRGLKAGKPKKLPQDALMAQQLIGSLMAENEALKGGGAGGPPGSGGPSGPPGRNGKTPNKGDGAPTEANLNAGARRDTAPV